MNITIVTGLPRSGTSMVAQIIKEHGFFDGVPKDFGKTQWNPKGMHENPLIRRDVIKKYLSHIHADPMGQNPLPNLSQYSIPYPGDLRLEVTRILMAQGWEPEQPIVIKEPKIALMWEHWHEAFSEAQWVIPLRPTRDVVKSCLQCAFMRKWKTEEEWTEWAKAYFKRTHSLMIRATACFVFTPHLAEGFHENIYDVLHWLGLTPDLDIVKRVVDKKHWHHGQEGKK